MKKIIYSVLAVSILFMASRCENNVGNNLDSSNKATETKHLYVSSIKNGYNVPV